MICNSTWHNILFKKIHLCQINYFIMIPEFQILKKKLNSLFHHFLCDYVHKIKGYEYM